MALIEWQINTFEGVKELINTIRNSHDLIFKAFIALLSLVAIVFIFPTEVKFKYEFQKGKPWLHDNLIAPFDFAIYKSPDELKQDKEEAALAVRPLFVRDTTVQDEQLKNFEQRFSSAWSQLDLSQEAPSLWESLTGKKPSLDSLRNIHRLRAKELLKEIFATGIVEQTDLLAKRTEAEDITVRQGNVSENVELKEVFTLQAAHNYAEEALKNEKAIKKDWLVPLIDGVLQPNLRFDQDLTQKLIDEKVNQVSETRGAVLQDEKIIDRGQVVTDELYQKLISLKRQYESELGGNQNYYLVLLGQVLLVGITLLVLILFLAIFRRDVINVSNRVTFIFLVFTLTVFMSALSLRFEAINIFVLPFCILPILIRAFFDERLATFTYTLAVILIGFFAPNGFEFVFIQFVTGTLVVLYLVSIRKRSQLLQASGLIFLTYSITYLGFSVIQEGNLQNIQWINLAWFAGSAVLVMLVYPLIFIFEKVFGFLSDITLMELSDTNNPLLRDLASKAPGTFQHSIQVANLAEAACLEVEGDAALVRTGALYHDIGKMKNSQLFIENQVSGINPHDDLSYEESAKLIIDHVISGIELAKKYNLPDIIIDFIRTHHGTTMTRYFYQSLKNENPDKEIDKALFTYPGPIPYSKETAILMMADSVEAASRSLKKYSEESINGLVENIINYQASEGQFENADITFKEITTIKKLFKRMLQNIYHVRVEYPE